MGKSILFSVVIPFRGDAFLLERCIASIPDREDIEVIITDNNKNGLPADYFKLRSNISILYSDPDKGAGHARNIGLQQAAGKWLLFADADDFYHSEAFDTFDRYSNSDADIIYFSVDSCYSNTLQPAHRGDYCTSLIEQYDENDVNSQNNLRYGFLGPWGKMIRRSLTVEHCIEFEERVAANDMWFSVQCGFYAARITAIRIPVYCITCLEGSISTIKDIRHLESIYAARVRMNAFLKERRLAKYQTELFPYFVKSTMYGLRHPLHFLKLAIKNKVNIFTGWRG